MYIYLYDVKNFLDELLEELYWDGQTDYETGSKFSLDEEATFKIIEKIKDRETFDIIKELVLKELEDNKPLQNKVAKIFRQVERIDYGFTSGDIVKYSDGTLRKLGREYEEKNYYMLEGLIFRFQEPVGLVENKELVQFYKPTLKDIYDYIMNNVCKVVLHYCYEEEKDKIINMLEDINPMFRFEMNIEEDDFSIILQNLKYENKKIAGVFQSVDINFDNLEKGDK